MNPIRYRIEPGSRVRLSRFRADDDGGLDRDATEKKTAKLSQRLIELQELLYAEGRRALLVVLQAPDCGGKDSTIRSVFGPLNSQGCRVTSFKAPAGDETRHDYLWRVHAAAPPRGEIGVFNRSHYEEVLIARVRELVPGEVWKRRYGHINEFERVLADEGTVILKFFLHISKDYQKERLARRLEKPDKYWKFDPADLAERERWPLYRKAYEDALRRCSTDHAPWYIVPAEHRWFRDFLITRVLVERLESLNMKFPKPRFEPGTIVVR